MLSVLEMHTEMICCLGFVLKCSQACGGEGHGEWQDRSIRLAMRLGDGFMRFILMFYLVLYLFRNVLNKNYKNLVELHGL